MAPAILMFGATGQLARAMADVAVGRAITLTALSRADADLTDERAVHEAIARAPQGSVVLNAAAYTAVDKAESESDTASAVNAFAPGVMAKAARDRGLDFIHVSTDYVFDGTKKTPYVESDETNPMSVYGRTKLAGEQAVTDAHPGAAIVRTSWIYSPYGANFLKTMLRLGAERDVVSVVDDQHGAPTSAHDIAEGLLALIAAPQVSGVYHLANSGEASWADFADAIFEHQARIWGRRPDVARVTSADYPTPVTRPANSRLNCDLFARDCGFRAPAWRESMRRVLDILNGG